MKQQPRTALLYAVSIAVAVFVLSALPHLALPDSPLMVVVVHAILAASIGALAYPLSVQSLQRRSRTQIANEQLLSSLDMLEVLIDNIRSNAAYLDPQFNFIRINSAYAQTFGGDGETFAGRNFFEVFPDPALRAIFEQARDTGQAVSYSAQPLQWPGQAERGTTYWDWSLAPVRDRAGQVQGLVLSLLDMTEIVLADQGRERLLEENGLQRKLLETIFEADPDGLAVMAGPDLTIRLANPAYRSLVPDPSVDILGRSYAEVWPVQEGLLWGDAVRQAAQTGVAADVASQECRYPDGRVRCLSLRLRPLPWERGQAMLMVLHDYTDEAEAQRRANAATLEAQRRADELDVIFSAMAESVIVYDSAGNVIRANATAKAILGHDLSSVDQAAVVRRLSFRRPGSGPVSVSDLPSTRALRGEVVRGERFLITDALGRRLCILASASPLWVDEQIGGAVSVWHEVTELERAEAEMRKAMTLLETSEERYHSLVLNASEAIVMLDGQGNILFWNKAAQSMFGHAEDEVAGKPFIFLLATRYLTDDDRQARLASLVSGKVDCAEAVGLRNTGGEFLLEYSGAPWTTSEGTFITTTVYDITARRQADEQAQRLAILEERQRLARELHDSVSQALYGVALGSNTALNMMGQDDERMAEALSYVISLADVALTEMRALIFELRPESLEREGLVAGLDKQAAALRVRHEIRVTTEWCEEPDVPLPVKEALYRIAMEAMHNAVRHARATEVSLRLDMTWETIDLEVNDNGVGFDLAQSFEGHLGLRSMRERAHSQGGTLEIESAPGQGTLVRAIIPLDD